MRSKISYLQLANVCERVLYIPTTPFATFATDGKAANS